MHLGKKVHCERCDDQIGGENCIQANSNECNRPAKTDFRLGEHDKFNKSELCHAGNCIEVSCHRTAKLNKMKTEKYTDPIKRKVVDDNIKMEVPDEIATDKGKINFKRKMNTEVYHVCARECWGRLSLLQHLKVHEGIQHKWDECS